MYIKEDKIIQELHGERKVSKYTIISEAGDKVVLQTELWGKSIYLNEGSYLVSEDEFYYSKYKRKASE